MRCAPALCALAAIALPAPAGAATVTMSRQDVPAMSPPAPHAPGHPAVTIYVLRLTAPGGEQNRLRVEHDPPAARIVIEEAGGAPLEARDGCEQDGAQRVVCAVPKGEDAAYARASFSAVELGDGDDELALLSPSLVVDVVDAGPGNDLVTGRALNVTGGEGDDTLSGARVGGGPGSDDISAHIGDGGDGDDQLLGGPGTDELAGGPGKDVLRGAGSDDLLIGGEGADVLDGGAGDDELDGESGSDTMAGGPGDDQIHARGGARFTCGPGADRADARGRIAADCELADPIGRGCYLRTRPPLRAGTLRFRVPACLGPEAPTRVRLRVFAGGRLLGKGRASIPGGGVGTVRVALAPAAQLRLRRADAMTVELVARNDTAVERGRLVVPR